MAGNHILKVKKSEQTYFCLVYSYPSHCTNNQFQIICLVQSEFAQNNIEKSSKNTEKYTTHRKITTKIIYSAAGRERKNRKIQKKNRQPVHILLGQNLNNAQDFWKKLQIIIFFEQVLLAQFWAI